jgi:hypothetical protein
MLTDPCYIRENWSDSMPSSDDFTPDENLDYSYTGACNATLGADRAGELDGGFAVATSTGFGDGTYPVYVTYSDEGAWGRRVKEMRVVFIDEEDA